MHHTPLPRRPSNHPCPQPVTKHYDPRFPPRPLTRVACLAYDEFTIHVYHTLYSPRRVILFSRPPYFLHLVCFVVQLGNCRFGFARGSLR
jgi:hypothetical protein